MCCWLLLLGSPSSLVCKGGAEFAEQFDRSNPKFHNGNPTVRSPGVQAASSRFRFLSRVDLRQGRASRWCPGSRLLGCLHGTGTRSLSGNFATHAAAHAVKPVVLQAESKNWRDMPDAPLSLEVRPAVPMELESRISCRTSCGTSCRMIMVRSTRCSWTHIRPSTTARRSTEMGAVSFGVLLP